MERYEFVVLVNPAEGMDEQFNEWYMRTHLPDVLKVPGFVSGQRFEIAHAQTRKAKPPYPWKYMTVFQVETDDLQGSLDELMARAHTPAMQMSPALGDRMAFAFKPITGVIPRTEA